MHPACLTPDTPGGNRGTRGARDVEVEKRNSAATEQPLRAATLRNQRTNWPHGTTGIIAEIPERGPRALISPTITQNPYNRAGLSTRIF